MSDTVYKTISIKHVGPIEREGETLTIAPGTTVGDVLNSLQLGGTGYVVTDHVDHDKVFQPTDDLYAIASDNQSFCVSAEVDAGSEVAA